MKYIVEKRDNLDFELYKKYLEVPPFLQILIDANIYIVIQCWFHIRGFGQIYRTPLNGLYIYN